MTDRYWLYKQLWSSKWYGTIIQRTSPRKLASKRTSAVSDGERGGGRRAMKEGCHRIKRQDGMGGVGGSNYFHHIKPSVFLSSSCFGTNRFIHRIGWGVQSTGWLLKVVYWGWPCLTFGTIDYRAIHQRSCKPLRRSARYKPSLGIKLCVLGGGWPPLDKWVKSLKLINEKQKNDKHTQCERAYQGPHIYTDAN